RIPDSTRQDPLRDVVPLDARQSRARRGVRAPGLRQGGARGALRDDGRLGALAAVRAARGVQRGDAAVFHDREDLGALMKISSLGYVGVGSARAKEWERFGPEILGTPLWTEPDDGVYLRIDERAYRIAVHPGERDELRYVGWEVASPTALTDAVEELRGKGLPVERGSADTRRRRHREGLC